MKSFKLIPLLAIILCTFTGSALAKEKAEEAWKKLVRSPRSLKRPAFQFVENDSKLPNVLVYGDSISIAYTGATREALKGKANVYRLYCNGGDSSSFITKMKNIIGESSRYLSTQQRHPSGLYGYHTSSTFLPCGKGIDCDRCSEHTSYHADKKAEKEQQLIQSLTSGLLPTQSIDAPFPFSDDQVHENAKKTATSFLKSMSKQINDGELVGSIPLAETLAEMFNEGVVTQVAHKYVANIISTFNSEQLKSFSEAKED